MPHIIRVCYVCWAVWVLVIQGLGAQSLYETKTLLRNTSYSVVWTPCWGPVFYDSTSNGSAQLIDLGNYRYELNYIPNAGFEGADSVTIEYYDFLPPTGKIKYKHYIFNVVKSYISVKDDYYQVYKNDQNVEVCPLSNDSSSIQGSGRLKIRNLTATNFLRSANILQDTLIKFTPETDFTGLAKINFTVCDTNNVCQDAAAIISVIDTNLLVSDTIIVGTPEDVNVVIPLNQSGYVVHDPPSKGRITLDNFSVLYDPNHNFYGKDTFIVSKGNIYRTVFVEVYAQDEPNGFIVNDVVVTSKDSTVYFNVRNNDLVRKYSILVDKNPALGTLTRLNSNGDFKYTPKSGYEGVQTFTYKACPQGICEKGLVTIYIGNYEPKNTKTYKFRTPKNVPILLNYQIPIDAYNVTATDTNFKFYPGHQSFTRTAHNGCTYTYTGYNQMIFTPGKDNGQAVYKFDLTYCVTSTNQCHTVKCEVEVFNEAPNCSKQCSGDCVWPGDVDLNGEVDMVDLLRVAYHLGARGSTRTYNGNVYRALSATNWNVSLPNTNVDLKNCDTDGNGVIEASDTTAVSAHYHKQHSLVPKYVIGRGQFPVEFNVLTPDVDSGDLALVEVVLGDGNNPVINLAGYAYNLDYNKDVVYEPSLNVDFYYQGWATANASVLHMFKKPWDGRLESGFGRGNAIRVSGIGGTEVLKFIVEDDIDGWRGDEEVLHIPFHFNGIVSMGADGELLEHEDRTAYLRLHRKKSHEPPVLDEKKLILFPNPVYEHFTLHLNGQNTMLAAELYNINGSSVRQYAAIGGKQHVFDVVGIAPGLYLIKVETALGPITKKVEILR